MNNHKASMLERDGPAARGDADHPERSLGSLSHTRLFMQGSAHRPITSPAGVRIRTASHLAEPQRHMEICRMLDVSSNRCGTCSGALASLNHLCSFSVLFLLVACGECRRWPITSASCSRWPHHRLIAYQYNKRKEMPSLAEHPLCYQFFATNPVASY